MTNYYIGFDNGTLGTKVAIYSQDSELMADAYYEHLIKYPHPGWAEMGPEQFYEFVVDGIKKCMSAVKIKPKDVKGISCSGVICGFVLIDDNWSPTGPYIPYLDGRAKEEARFVSEKIEPIWIEESGNSEIGAYMPPLILKWLINNEKEIIKKTKKIVTASQYVLGKLGNLKGRQAFMDWSHMSGWIIGFDILKRDWSPRQMELLGLPYDILPEIKKPWDIVGFLSKEQAEKTGLVEGIPLVAGGGDIMQSNIGSGVVDAFVSSDVAGTSSIFTIELDKHNKDIGYARTLYSSMSTFEDQFSYWGFVPSGGFALRWLRDEVYMKNGEDDFYREMDKLAEKIPIGSDNVFFFPFLQGRSSPSWPNASAAYIGLYGSNNAGNLWRSTLEAVAFEYLNWSNIFRNIGIELKEAVAIGGGSKSNLWNKIKSDVLNLKYVTLERSEGAVMGNAILAAYGVGDIKDMKKTAREWVKIKKVFEPDKKSNETYRNIFEKREKILNGPMKDIFSKLVE